MEAVKLRVTLIAMMVLAFLVHSPAFSSEGTWKQVEAGRVQEMLKQGKALWLVDIRSTNSYEEGHIEGSVNIVSSSLPSKKIPATKTIVLVDNSLGQKAAIEAAAVLLKNGNERVYVLEGGITAWISEGLPVAGKNPYRMRGVTAAEFKTARSAQVALRVFDMRTAVLGAKTDFPDSEKIEGNDIREKLAGLKKKLKAEESRGLQNKLNRRKPVILVFSASENIESLMERAFAADAGDVRYLIGGYEAFTAEKTKQVAGGCKTCSEK
jgi:rhodanese-related sulfurtransferase